MRTVLFVSNVLPHPVSTFLAVRGYNVLEANAGTAAVELAQSAEVDVVIVAPGCDDDGLRAIRQRRVTLELSIHATGSDVFFELSNLFDPPAAIPH